MTKNQEIEQLIQWRRDLHRIPELEMTLPKTQSYLLKQLEPLNCTLTRPVEYGIAAYFDAGKNSTIAFRSDMDGLPVNEQTNLPFQSKHPHQMHACGHDGHMSNLLLLAKRLSDNLDQLAHNVLLIFQPGEESPGGALPICESGILEEHNVKAIFALHLWPLLPKGTIASRIGPLMSRSSEVNVQITGKSVHAARYQEGIDAVEIGARFLQEAYKLEASLPKDIFRLLRFGKMEGGTVRNAVAAHCCIEGTLRAFEDEYYDLLRNGLEEIARRLSQETGADISLHFSNGYPAVLNDPSLFQAVSNMRPDLVTLKKPEMISEDFSWYQKYVPGLFFFLGTGTGIELHNPHFDFEEDLLLQGANLFHQIATTSF